MAEKYTGTGICRDLKYVDIEFQPKVLAVLADVNDALAKKGLSAKIRLAIFETQRSEARQKILFRDGYSKTLKSKHMESPCKATDVVFQRYTSKTGKWEWYWPALDSWEWDLVDSSAKAHNIDRIAWDAPHLEMHK